MLTGTLPRHIEASATRRKVYSTEIVEVDGGSEHRNARRQTPVLYWDITTPALKRTDPDYLEIDALFDAALGSFDSFMLHDFVDCVDVPVRFDDDTLTTTAVGNLLILSFTLREDT